MLSDHAIRRCLEAGTIVIDPIDHDSRIQGASVDVRLGAEFLVMRGPMQQAAEDDIVDPKTDTTGLMVPRTIPDGSHFILYPGLFALATTVERVRISPMLVARLEGKSSLGRLGLGVHSTAGFIDPGFDGQITLELTNNAPLPIKLWPGMPIGQLAFDRLDQSTGRPYAGKYQGQAGPQPSQYHRNWDADRQSWTPSATPAPPNPGGPA